MRIRERLSVDLYDRLVDELGENLFHVYLYNWGEPQLHKELGYFIRRLNQNDVFTTIDTNLSVKLLEATAVEILASGIDRIEASIDGFSQESYEKYRIGGDFELAKRNIFL